MKKDELLKWLKEHHREHELLAAGARKHGGSERYIQEQDHKAQLVSEIIEIVEQSGKECTHILYTTTNGYPGRIAFRTAEEAARFAEEYNLKNCHLMSVMYGDQWKNKKEQE